MTETWAIIVIIIGSLVGAIGAFLIKKGGFSTDIKKLSSNHLLIGGVLLYALSPIINIVAFKGGDLTVVYPFFTFTYIWSSMLAVKYLGEKMNIYKFAGIFCIIFGTIFITTG